MGMKQIVLTLVVNVDDEDTNNGELLHHIEAADMGLLMRDALSEFVARRGWSDLGRDGLEGIKSYVAERYKWMRNEQQSVKQFDVFTRCWIASVVKRGEVKLEVK
jgi:hypothetical protein